MTGDTVPGDLRFAVANFLHGTKVTNWIVPLNLGRCNVLLTRTVMFCLT